MPPKSATNANVIIHVPGSPRSSQSDSSTKTKTETANSPRTPDAQAGSGTTAVTADTVRLSNPQALTVDEPESPRATATDSAFQALMAECEQASAAVDRAHSKLTTLDLHMINAFEQPATNKADNSADPLNTYATELRRTPGGPAMKAWIEASITSYQLHGQLQRQFAASNASRK